jgi:hypothetical protein
MSVFTSDSVFPFSYIDREENLRFSLIGQREDRNIKTSINRPFQDLYAKRLKSIKGGFNVRNKPLTLCVLGCGDLLPKLLLPALTRVLEEIRLPPGKLRLILSDAPNLSALTETPKGADIRGMLERAHIPFEFYQPSQLTQDVLESIDVAYIATPPPCHLKNCEYLIKESNAYVFNEKPACQPHEIEDMKSLDASASGRLFHVDWVLGAFPIQYLLGCEEGARILRSFGRPSVINHIVVESAPVDPDRNGVKDGYGLLARSRQREAEYGHDLVVGMANDLGVHGLYQAYLLHGMIEGMNPDSHGELSSFSPTNWRARYARAKIESEFFGSFDDTSGSLTFDLGTTSHNVVWGKHLPFTFKGFDAINASGARLLACYGAPATNNEREGDRKPTDPYLLYIPGTTEKSLGTHIIFPQNGDERYVGIVLNLLAAGLGVTDLILPRRPNDSNLAALCAVADLARLKREHYDNTNYALLEQGDRPNFLPCGSRTFGVPPLPNLG